MLRYKFVQEATGDKREDGKFYPRAGRVLPEKVKPGPSPENE